MRSQTLAWAGAGEQKAHDAASFERIGIFAAFLVLCVLSYYRNVNWDEFYFLSHVHAWLDGRLDRPMQTGFVHAFAWLDLLPGHEMEQIFGARLVMVGCLAVTCLSIHRIACHFTTARCANIAVLAFLCAGFTLPHGGSFRSDPIAAALLTSALAIAITSRLAVGHILLAGLLVALSFLVTIKSALYLPAFAGAIIWRMKNRSDLMRLCLLMLAAFVLATTLYFWHASGIVAAEGNETTTNAKDAVNTALLKSGLFPRADVILSWALFSLPQLFLALLGLWSAGKSRLSIVLCLFIVPLLSVVIYRNAYAYFFPFATPLLMIAVAVGAHRIGSPKAMFRLGVLMIIGAVLQLVLIAPEHARSQRETIAEVHRLFDTPVPYIEGYGKIASFPNAAFFMSSWGIARHRAAGQPVFAEIIEAKRPPLLITNKRALRFAMMANSDIETSLDLLAEDRKVLSESYIHYSGSIWLAGAEAVLGTEPARIKLPFSGRYRIETDGQVQINAAPVANGSVLAIDNPTLQVEGTAGTKLRLIWDTGVTPIPRNALEQDNYVGFKKLVL